LNQNSGAMSSRGQIAGNKPVDMEMQLIKKKSAGGKALSTKGSEAASKKSKGKKKGKGKSKEKKTKTPK